MRYHKEREAKKRSTHHTSEFKANIALEALRGVKTINDIGQKYGVHPVTGGQYKKEIQEQAKTLFEGKRGPKAIAAHREAELLYSESGNDRSAWQGTSPSTTTIVRTSHWIKRSLMSCIVYRDRWRRDDCG